MSVGVRTVASAYAGWVTSRRRRRAPRRCEPAAASRSSTPSLTTPPSSSTARASSPSSLPSAAPIPAATSAGDFVPVVGGDAVGRQVDVLRGGAHLAGVEREREREVLAHRLEVVGRVDDDGVDAGLLGEHDRLAGVVLQPVAEGVAAGEVDQPHLGPHRQRRGQLVGRVLGGEGDQVAGRSRPRPAPPGRPAP